MTPNIPPAYPFTPAGLALVKAQDAAAQKLLLALGTVQYVTPTTGQTVVSNGSEMLAINPAGTLLALTVTLPSSPTDKQLFNIVTSQQNTSLTINGGTIVGTLSTLALGGFATYRYLATPGLWFRSG